MYMYITGTKFQLQCLNTSRDILYFVIYNYLLHRYHLCPFSFNISRMRADIARKIKHQNPASLEQGIQNGKS